MMRRRRRTALALLATVLTGLGAVAAVRQEGLDWRLENASLTVTVSSTTGIISVLDRRSDLTWTARAVAASPLQAPLMAAARLTTPPRVDARLNEWSAPPPIQLTHTMLADARQIDDDADCSASVWYGWDAEAFYIAAAVRDDRLNFAAQPGKGWWTRDCLEVWLGARQLGLVCGRNGALWYAGKAAGSGEVVTQPIDGGYQVEAAIPWSAVREQAPEPGETLAFAVGVNDADQGDREGQLYFPRGWQHSQPQTFARIRLEDEKGRFPAEDNASNAILRQVTPLHEPDGLSFEVDTAPARVGPAFIRMTMPADGAELRFELDVKDREAALDTDFTALHSFAPDAGDLALAVADYCNGHLYPLDLEQFPRRYFSADRLDMPWLGIVDTTRGTGAALIIETADDAAIRMDRQQSRGNACWKPELRWRPSRRCLRVPRRWRWVFASQGGYVALAKAYREYAGEQGLLVTLAAKATANPNVKRLFGAPDVWGDASLDFARRAKALGVKKMLIHGTSPPADMQQVNDLGYLTSKYDNYTDILPLKPGGDLDHNHAPLPAHAVLQANGERMKAWLTFDKKTQYMKRCPALWTAAAKTDITRDLQQYPYLGRFIDVTTAEALYECDDAAHPLTRTGKRECGVALGKLVWDLGLVTGGEHGIWWAVPWQCYIEGMMSCNHYFSWPAGHLRHPKTKDAPQQNPWGRNMPSWKDYAEYGIGHRYRVPLWELVFHDCIVSTWYWGDASDWLLDAAPEITAKKDAFNILYGTIPLLWANGEGSWRRDRSRFLRSYRNTCLLHECIAGREMLSHEFIGEARALQKTRFAGGTEIVVNFGADPCDVDLAGQTYRLPEYGFAVVGPEIRQSCALEAGARVTRIRTAERFCIERGSSSAILDRKAPGRVEAMVDAPDRPIAVRLQDLAPHWRLDRTLIYALADNGAPIRPERLVRVNDSLLLGPFPTPTRLLLLGGSATEHPDLAPVFLAPAPESEPPRQGTPLKLRIQVRNHGFAAGQARLRLLAEAPEDSPELAATTVKVPERQARTITLSVPTESLDGARRICCLLDTADDELCHANDRHSLAVEITPDLDRWPIKLPLAMHNPGSDRRHTVAATTVDVAPYLPQPEGNVVPLALDSLRVAEMSADGLRYRILPAQFRPVPDFDARARPVGKMLWEIPGLIRNDEQRQFLLLAQAGKASVLPADAGLWTEAERRITTATYEARFDSTGNIVSLAPRHDGKTGPDFLRRLFFSSAVTGWDREREATLDAFDVTEDGPVCCRIVTRKHLKTGIVVDRTYSFYPGWFEVAVTTSERANGLYSRALYRLPGRYVDDQGNTADMDGDGAENGTTYGKNRAPRWYAIRGTGWSQACIALTAFDHIAYWDSSGAMGQIGLVSQETKDVRMAYVVRGDEPDAAFAEAAYQQLRERVTVTVSRPEGRKE